MSVKLRLMRTGRRKQPAYRIVAVDSRVRRDGAYIEKIGHYNPLTRPAEVILDDQKALKWLNEGATPSDTVRNLLSRRGLMLAFDLQKHGVQEEEIWSKVAQYRLEKEEKLRQTDKAPVVVKPQPAKPKKEEAAPEPVAAEAEPVEAASEAQAPEAAVAPTPEAAPVEPAPDAAPEAPAPEVVPEAPTPGATSEAPAEEAPASEPKE